MSMLTGNSCLKRLVSLHRLRLYSLSMTRACMGAALRSGSRRTDIKYRIETLPKRSICTGLIGRKHTRSRAIRLRKSETNSAENVTKVAENVMDVRKDVTGVVIEAA